MAIDKSILDFLTKHKFKNNEVVSYVPMNDQSDKSTLTDTENKIASAFRTNNFADISTIIEAIFDDGKGGKVSKMKGGKANEFVYTVKDESFTVSYTVNNHVVTFTKGDKKMSIHIELAPLAEHTIVWKDQKKDIVTQISKINNFADFKKWALNYVDTK